MLNFEVSPPLYRPATLPRVVLAFLVAVCLLGVRAQAPLASAQTQRACACLDVADTAIALGNIGASRNASAFQHGGSFETKLLGSLPRLDRLALDSGESHLLSIAFQVPSHSAVVRPTSGRSPPVLTL